jgi:hypothetical protein
LFTGDWLFCAKKPPKTEDHETELTHHQRAHIKLNRTDMFGKRSVFFPAGIEISFDDKAYVRPRTDGNNIKMKRYTVNTHEILHYSSHNKIQT